MHSHWSNGYEIEVGNSDVLGCSVSAVFFGVLSKLVSAHDQITGLYDELKFLLVNNTIVRKIMSLDVRFSMDQSVQQHRIHQ